MTTGTEQRERFPMALEPGYFRPDDLSFEQRVDMMARLAEQLRFIDLDDQEDGDWRGLFATDPTLVMAGIAALDPWPLQQQFGRDADSAPPCSSDSAERLVKRSPSSSSSDARTTTCRIRGIPCGSSLRPDKPSRASSAVPRRTSPTVIACIGQP